MGRWINTYLLHWGNFAASEFAQWKAPQWVLMGHFFLFLGFNYMMIWKRLISNSEYPLNIPNQFSSCINLTCQNVLIFSCVFLSAKSAVWRAEPQTARRGKNLVWPSGIFTEEISLWWGQSSCNENIFLVMYEVSLTRGSHLYWAIIKCYFNFISWLNYRDWSNSIRAEFFEHKVFKYFLNRSW